MSIVASPLKKLCWPIVLGIGVVATAVAFVFVSPEVLSPPHCESPQYPVPCQEPLISVLPILVPILIVVGVALWVVGYVIQRKHPELLATEEEERKHGA
jgi:hypothetical protein